MGAVDEPLLNVFQQLLGDGSEGSETGNPAGDAHTTVDGTGAAVNRLDVGKPRHGRGRGERERVVVRLLHHFHLRRGEGAKESDYKVNHRSMCNNNNSLSYTCTFKMEHSSAKVSK